MGKATGIQWCDHTFNPWWGCIKVSPGCEHCYADTLASRYGYDVWGPAKTTQRRVFGSKHWNEPLAWNAAALKAGERRRVFCASMADVFEDHPMLVAERIQLWALIGSTPNLDWLLLTKRPENITRMVPQKWLDRAQPNVWYGTSVENEDYVGRISHLQQIPAVVRFVSYEPALGPVNWLHNTWLSAIDWLIIGGESGPGARPFNIDWARASIAACAFGGVAPFVKQLGSNPVDSAGMSLKLKSYKGDDMDEWPVSLVWREFPVGATELVPA
jgi:protein gp37